MTICQIVMRSCVMIVLTAVVSVLASTSAAQESRSDTIHDSGGDRSEQIRDATLPIMGQFPDRSRRVDLAIEIVEEVDCGSYVRRQLTYQSEPGSRTPAYLCLPKSASSADQKIPAILCLHPTDSVYGNKVAVGLAGKPGRNYGAELAQQGYVTISPAYPLLADYWPNLPKLGYISGTMKAIWDNSRALDLLESLENVDSSRGFGAIGHSLGGHNAIYTAVFEPRITAIVSSCGFDEYTDYMAQREDRWLFGKGWCQLRYMPLLSNYRNRLEEMPLRFADLIAAIAPRQFYISAPKHDTNFNAASVDRIVDAVRPIDVAHNANEHLIVRHPDVGHDFPGEVREEAYAMFDSVLR